MSALAQASPAAVFRPIALFRMLVDDNEAYSIAQPAMRCFGWPKLKNISPIQEQTNAKK
jgi:hypothetical protein